LGTSSYTVPDSTARALPTVLPNGGQANIDRSLYALTLAIKDDGSLSNGVCTPAAIVSGNIAVTVITPQKVTTTINIPVSN
jgi:hypothetical protein